MTGPSPGIPLPNPMSTTADKILETAIRMIREGGYHSFSFRQIADELGVKSSSIHYHFPTKEALGVAVAEKYTRDFLEALGDPAEHEAPIDLYVATFQNALEGSGTSCLCGILAAEAMRLPDPVKAALTQFTEKNITWLESAIQHLHPDWDDAKVRGTAWLVFSSLEGAIIFAALQNDPAHLARVGQSLSGSFA